MNIKITEDGDMGIPEHYLALNPLEFQIIAPHIAEILDGCYQAGLRSIKYGFLIKNVKTHRIIDLLIKDLEMKLPPTVKFYESDGNKVFNIRGPSGGIATHSVCYLIVGSF